MKTRPGRSTQSGVAIIEFALILPFLLLLTFTVTEFGRAIMQYDTLTKSVRQAARYLAMQTPGTKITEAKNLVVYGNTAGTGSPMLTGLTLANVPDPTWQNSVGAAPPIDTVTVQVTGYTFTTLVPVGPYGTVFGPFTFAPIAATLRSQP
jgi:Flp pilus assembly protein TadG